MRRQTTRRGFLAAGGVALAGCLGGGDNSNADPPDGPVANAPIPAEPASYDYATMGDRDAAVTATYFSNWKCPHCADFSEGFLGTLVTEYVEPGDVSIQHRALAYTRQGPWMGSDAPRAARAGLSVWYTAPESYWRFHEHVMANQASPGDNWATTDRLVELAREAGVGDLETVRSDIESGAYEDAVRATSSVAAQVGVSSTPSLVIGSDIVSALDESTVRSTLDDAIAND